MSNPFSELASLIKIGKKTMPLGEADKMVREGLGEVAEHPKIKQAEEATVDGAPPQEPPVRDPDLPEGTPPDPSVPLKPADVSDLELEQVVRSTEQKRLGEVDTNTNFEKINSEEDIFTMLDDISRQSKAAGEGPPPRTTLEEVAARAGHAEIIDLKDILGNKAYKKAEKILQPDQLVAMRNLYVTLADDLYRQAQKISVAQRHVTDEELAIFRANVGKFRAVQEVVQGQTRFAGQLLGSFRISAAPNSPLRDMEIIGALDEIGGRDVAMTLAGDISRADGVRKVAKITEMGAFAKSLKFLDSYRYNSMLSAPETHMRNITGNLGALVVRIAEKPVAAIAGSARVAARGVDEMAHSQDQRIFLRETVAEIGGLVYGTLEGVSLAWKALKDPDFKIGQATMAEVQFRPQLLGTRWAQKTPITKAIAFMGDLMLLNGATRALGAMDVFFKGVMYQADASARAVRQGLAEGLEGDELLKRVTDLARTPRADLFQRSLAEIEMATFTTRLEGAAGSVQKAINQFPAMRLVVPFMRVIVNLTKWSAQRSFPINIPGAVKAFKEGGIASDQMVAKMATGAMIGYYAYDQVAQGKLTGTGAFVSEQTRRNWLKAGWRPGAMLNDKTGEYESIVGFAPVSTVLLYYASMAEAFHFSEDEVGVDDYMLGTIAVFAEVTINQSFARGMFEWLQAIDDPGRYGSRPAKSLAMTAVPNWARWMRRQMDSEVRDKYTGTFAGDLIAGLKDKTPGLSDHLPPATDYFGRDVGPGYDMLNMMPSTDGSKDWRLYEAMIQNRMSMRKDKPKIRLAGEELDLFDVIDPRGDGYAYYQWQRFMGQSRRMMLNSVVRSTEYQNAPPGEAGASYGGVKTRGAILRVAMTQAKQDALEKMAERYPQLAPMIEQERLMQNESLAPLPPHMENARKRIQSGEPAFDKVSFQ